MNEEEMTPEEEEELGELLDGYGSPRAARSFTVPEFLNKIRLAKDTLKTGNLTAEEVGMIRLPVRSVQEFALYSKELCKDKVMEDVFNGESEIITASSLSKDAKLITLGVVQKKEWSDSSSKPRKQNRGWFKSKNQLSDYQQE